MKYKKVNRFCLLIFLFLTFSFLIVPTFVYGAIYYVAKDGKDSNPGTEVSPWLTIQKAADTMVAGDTVYIKEGTFKEQVIPKNSGVPDNYITYQAYPGHGVIIDGENTRNQNILIQGWRNTNYLIFKDLKVRNAVKAGFEAYASGNINNIILDHITSEYNGEQGILFAGTSTGSITDSVIKSCEVHYNSSDGISISQNNHRILIDGNHASYNIRPIDHRNSNISVWANTNYPELRNTNIIITNNECHHGGTQGIWIEDANKVLIRGNHSHHNGASGIQIEVLVSEIIVEENICEHNGQYWDHETGIWIDETKNALVQNNLMRYNQKGLGISESFQIIVRNNVIYENNRGTKPNSSGGINLWGKLSGNMGESTGGKDYIIVHNTLSNNGDITSEWGNEWIGMFSYPQIYGTIFKNNISNITNGKRDLRVHYTTHILDYNDYYNTRDLIIDWQNQDMTWANYITASNQDSHSITKNPEFVDLANANFHLQSNSPCIDKGGFLTKTVNSGVGMSLKVEDARYFTDGYGVIEGDLIQVGLNSPVKITSINYDTNAIVVDRSIPWNEGDGVSYSYSGSAPDIGAYEYAFLDEDTTPPSAITNLSYSNLNNNSVALNWTSPGDDGNSGTATSYDIRYSTSNITNANWSFATQVFGEPTPSAAGASQSMTIAGLFSNTVYYFAMKTSDEVPNVSALSNVVSAATTSADATPPAVPSGLAVA